MDPIASVPVFTYSFCALKNRTVMTWNPLLAEFEPETMWPEAWSATQMFVMRLVL